MTFMRHTVINGLLGLENAPFGLEEGRPSLAYWRCISIIRA